MLTTVYHLDVKLSKPEAIVLLCHHTTKYCVRVLRVETQQIAACLPDWETANRSHHSYDKLNSFLPCMFVSLSIQWVCCLLFEQCNLLYAYLQYTNLIHFKQ